MTAKIENSERGSMDNVVKFLTDHDWDREPDLVVKDRMNRPVFSISMQKDDVFKVVVGPLWTTYYRLHRDVITEIDSVKTADLIGVSAAITRFVKG